MKRILTRVAIAGTVLASFAFATPALADTIGPINFESPTYTTGSINGQDGWSSTGAYDQGVVPSPVISGSQSFRISNAVTSGSFGDQTFSKPLTDSAGETGSDPSGFPQGTLQSHFESQFTIKAIADSIGDLMSVSPDTGNGGRMSYLRFDNESDGVHVYFDDVQGTDDPANFVETEITPALDAATAHTIKFVIDFVDGSSNDVVKIYVDSTLVHTGTSWENYYRYDSESNPSHVVTFTHSVRSMLFRAGGTAVPANIGKGFLIDDLSLMSPTPDTTPPPVPTNVSPADDSFRTTANQLLIDWSDVTDPSSPVTYIYEASNSSATNGDGSFVTPVYVSGPLSASEIPTGGTPEGVYYWHVKAVDGANNSSGWSAPWRITVDDTLPTITLTTPADGTTYPVTPVINASYTCADALSGIASCVGDAADGSSIDMLPGTHSFTAVATDKSGNVATKVVNYTVSSPVVTTPTFKDQCMAGAWKTHIDNLGNHFKNQGDCVSFVATKSKNKGAGQ